MPTAIQQVLVAIVTMAAVGLLSGGEWPHFVIGAVLALALWVMLFAGSYAGPRHGRVDTVDYAIGAVLGVGLGYVMTVVGDGPTWWAVGFILAGAIAPSGRSALRPRRDGE